MLRENIPELPHLGTSTAQIEPIIIVLTDERAPHITGKAFQKYYKNCQL